MLRIVGGWGAGQHEHQHLGYILPRVTGVPHTAVPMRRPIKESCGGIKNSAHGLSAVCMNECVPSTAKGWSLTLTRMRVPGRAWDEPRMHSRYVTTEKKLRVDTAVLRGHFSKVYRRTWRYQPLRRCLRQSNLVQNQTDVEKSCASRLMDTAGSVKQTTDTAHPFDGYHWSRILSHKLQILRGERQNTMSHLDDHANIIACMHRK